MDNSSWRYACIGYLRNRNLFCSYSGWTHYRDKYPSPVHSRSRNRPGCFMFLLNGADIFFSCHQFASSHHDALFPYKVPSGLRQRGFYARRRVAGLGEGNRILFSPYLLYRSYQILHGRNKLLSAFHKFAASLDVHDPFLGSCRQPS